MSTAIENALLLTPMRKSPKQRVDAAAEPEPQAEEDVAAPPAAATPGDVAPQAGVQAKDKADAAAAAPSVNRMGARKERVTDQGSRPAALANAS